MSTPNPNPDTLTLRALKAFVTGSTLLISGGMLSTSSQYIPSLISAAQKAPLHPTVSSLESGRLTPQPDETKRLTIAPNAPSATASDGYRLPAQQFVQMSRTAFATQVPAELLSIVASGYLAYRGYQSTNTFSSPTPFARHRWTAIALLIASVFPLTGALMVPIDHKIAQIGGEEEKPEPFEDAPLDREAERRNTVEFLQKWNGLNWVRSGVMVVAGGMGLWSLVE